MILLLAIPSLLAWPFCWFWVKSSTGLLYRDNFGPSRSSGLQGSIGQNRKHQLWNVPNPETLCQP